MSRRPTEKIFRLEFCLNVLAVLATTNTARRSEMRVFVSTMLSLWENFGNFQKLRAASEEGETAQDIDVGRKLTLYFLAN